jgi:RNA polymerase sigma-B factor
MIDANTSRDEYLGRYHSRCRREARRFLRRGLEIEDLEQIALIGLIKAVDRFEPAYGPSFWPFARAHVLGELMHYARDHEAFVRLPRSLYELHRRELRAQSRLLAELGREPSLAEIAHATGCGEAEVSALHCARYRCNVADIDEMQDLRSPSYRVEERTMIWVSLERLDRDEQELLLGVYGLRLSQTEAGRRLGHTQRSASRLHKRALQKLSLSLGEK